MSSPALWIIAALVLIFAGAILGRRRHVRPSRERAPERPAAEPLHPGESYDTSVKLATVPNMPLADLWCQRLRAEGIEAYYTSGFVQGIFGGPAANPAFPTEIRVGEHDLPRARELFPELA